MSINNPTTKIARTCMVCGSQFFVFPYRLKLNQGRYCSRKCWYISRDKWSRAICKTCNSSFMARNSEISRRCGLYCSRDCFMNRELENWVSRFWKYVQKEDGCWRWIGPHGKYGYGTLSGIPWSNNHKGKELSHRISWVINRGPIPHNMYVLHTCDQPSCVNPDHLFLGTQIDNNNDKVSKVRQAMGEKLPQSKLNAEDIRHIRSLRTYGLSLYELADIFRVDFSNIGRIVRRESWKHIP
jgi:hypothetical protein